MSWNHRVIASIDENGEALYQVHEVYYYEDGRLMGCTEKGVAPMGETSEMLLEEIERFVAAFTKPILTEEDFPHE